MNVVDLPLEKEVTVRRPKEIVDGQRLIADSKEPRRNVSRCVADLG